MTNDINRLKALSGIMLTESSDTNEGWETLPPIDTEKYQERPGLEGPFQTRAGKVVYYDPKEGAYYDPSSDVYLTYDEWKELDLPEAPMKNEGEFFDDSADKSNTAMAKALKQIEMTFSPERKAITDKISDMARTATMLKDPRWADKAWGNVKEHGITDEQSLVQALQDMRSSEETLVGHEFIVGADLNIKRIDKALSSLTVTEGKYANDAQRKAVHAAKAEKTNEEGWNRPKISRENFVGSKSAEAAMIDHIGKQFDADGYEEEHIELAKMYQVAADLFLDEDPEAEVLYRKADALAKEYGLYDLDEAVSEGDDANSGVYRDEKNNIDVHWKQLPLGIDVEAYRDGERVQINSGQADDYIYLIKQDMREQKTESLDELRKLAGL